MSREVARRSSMLLLALSCAAVVACGGGDGGGSSEAGAEGGGGSFPVTIEHKLGTAEIRSRPERIVALGEPAADIASAMRSPSVLSIPYALDALEPGLDRATR